MGWFLHKPRGQSCWNGWLVQVLLRNLVLGQSNLVLHLWVYSFIPLISHDPIPLLKLNYMLRMQKSPWHSHARCHELGWTCFHGAVLSPNSIYLLENWINFSLTWQGGGGLRLRISWHIWPTLGGSRILLKSLKNPISNKWWNEIPPSTSSNWMFIWYEHKV